VIKRIAVVTALAFLALFFLSLATERVDVGQVSESSYIEGNGAVTFISKGGRKAAPNIEGELLDGSQFVRNSNQLLVVNVWASWCSPCRAEAPTLQALTEKYPDVQFLGILTRDNLKAANAFIERFGITFPSLKYDDVILKFNDVLIANAIPTTIIIDEENKVAARISGEVTFTGMSKLIDEISNE
jgi:thiol-disulfide isomerase/thioredoxin